MDVLPGLTVVGFAVIPLAPPVQFGGGGSMPKFTIWLGGTPTVLGLVVVTTHPLSGVIVVV